MLSLFKKGLGLLFGGGLSGISDLYGTIAGSKTQQESNTHDEQMALREQVAAEQSAPVRVGLFDRFVDALSRLVRPFMMYAIVGLFVWCFYDAIKGLPHFAIAMSSLALIPEPAWIIIGTVISFWFGARSIFKDRVNAGLSSNVVRQVNQNISEIRASYDALHQRVQQVETAPIAQVEQQLRGDERDQAAELIHSEQSLVSDEELARSMRAAEPMSLPSIIEWNRRRQAQPKG